jgi:polyferredoxin
MFVSLLNRERLDVSVLNDRNPLFVKLSDGSIRNGFTIKILNMEQRPRSFVVSAEGLIGSTMKMTGGDGEPLREFNVDVEADKLRAIKIYVSASPLLLKSEQTPFVFKVVEQGAEPTPETRNYAAIFHAPPKETTP